MRKRGYIVIFLVVAMVLMNCYVCAKSIVMNSDNIGDIIKSHQLRLEAVDRELKEIEFLVKEYARIIEQYE